MMNVVNNSMTGMKDILDAIKSVKGRMNKAMMAGRFEEMNQLMGDLIALENCLVTEVDLYINGNKAA